MSAHIRDVIEYQPFVKEYSYQMYVSQFIAGNGPGRCEEPGLSWLSIRLLPDKHLCYAPYILLDADSSDIANGKRWAFIYALFKIGPRCISNRPFNLCVRCWPYSARRRVASICYMYALWFPLQVRLDIVKEIACICVEPLRHASYLLQILAFVVPGHLRGFMYITREKSKSSRCGLTFMMGDRLLYDLFRSGSFLTC